MEAITSCCSSCGTETEFLISDNLRVSIDTGVESDELTCHDCLMEEFYAFMAEVNDLAYPASPAIECTAKEYPW